MLSFRTIEPHTLELLKHLMQVPEFSELRLVGGTALALQYGHRTSVDLDLFGHIALEDDEFLALLQTVSTDIRVLNERRNIHQYFINGIKVDFVNYAYPWIDDVRVENGIRLATPPDIAAMKVNAIEGRGSRKDFVDMYVLLQHYSLKQILDFYKQKYPEHSEFRALRSLAYFEDAEAQFMPNMFIPTDWGAMKAAIETAVADYGSYQN